MFVVLPSKLSPLPQPLPAAYPSAVPMVCGRSDAYGGAVYAEESISISNTSFLNNMVALVPAMSGGEAWGSAVCVDATSATTLVTVALDSCTLTGNIAFHAANSYIATSKAAISVIQVTKLKLDSCVFNRNIANKGQVRRRSASR